ncbi:MAG: C40 family peptidase [Candidatus Geothermincolia bacterium]
MFSRGIHSDILVASQAPRKIRNTGMTHEEAIVVMTSKHVRSFSIAVLLVLAACVAGCVSKQTTTSTAPAAKPRGPVLSVSAADLRSAMQSARSLAGDAKRVEVLYIALRELGKKTKLGGTGPDIWDCSGLVQSVYGKVGVKLPRVTFDQVNEGTEVPPDKLAPADLLFYFHNGHVGIYIGQGLMIHAWRGAVKVDRLAKFENSLSAARRVI